MKSVSSLFVVLGFVYFVGVYCHAEATTMTIFPGFSSSPEEPKTNYDTFGLFSHNTELDKLITDIQSIIKESAGEVRSIEKTWFLTKGVLAKHIASFLSYLVFPQSELYSSTDNFGNFAVSAVEEYQECKTVPTCIIALTQLHDKVQVLIELEPLHQADLLVNDVENQSTLSSFLRDIETWMDSLIKMNNERNSKGFNALKKQFDAGVAYALVAKIFFHHEVLVQFCCMLQYKDACLKHLAKYAHDYFLKKFVARPVAANIFFALAPGKNGKPPASEKVGNLIAQLEADAIKGEGQKPEPYGMTAEYVKKKMKPGFFRKMGYAIKGGAKFLTGPKKWFRRNKAAPTTPLVPPTETDVSA